MGFLVLLKLTSSEFGAQGGVVILTLTLTRAPLLVQLTSVQGNLVAHFLDERLQPASVGSRGRQRSSAVSVR
ncbi:hypothetical protein A8144_12825 [Mycobacterium leprae 3125609]|nr:hypothetical protein [Mycobacterium leprae]OAR19922.1 hypothetical protein A8144_12825 [Mycobacterium leprae 3125609]OAX70085.1 hypothetical protein A3216_14130 [Mycobacterium leprae 7935681]